MSNPAYSVIKIGKSAQDPTKYRAKELYQTGVPEPMKVEYSALVEDEDLLERLVHQRFDASRPNKGREFFQLDVLTIIDGIRELAADRSPIMHEQVFYVYDDALNEVSSDQDIGDEDQATESQRKLDQATLEEAKRFDREWLNSSKVIFLLVFILFIYVLSNYEGG